MDAPVHSMTHLFAQLGLAADGDSIRGFVAAHRPLADGTVLSDAPFWTVAQSQFLCEEMIEDADWAPVIDRLNAALRAESGNRS
jgi:hypothetical protein